MSNTAGKDDPKIMRLVEAFEDVFDDIEVRHPAQVPLQVPADTPALSLLGCSTTVCLPIQQEISTVVCLQCDHFIGIQRAEDGSVVLRCWSHKARRPLARGTETLKAVTGLL